MTEPLRMSQDEFELVKDLQARISDAIEVAWWSSRPATAAVMEIVAPLIVRAEADAAKVAALRSVLLEGGQSDATARRRAMAIIWDETQERSEEESHPRVTVDLNVRVRKHETYSGFDDVAGADPASLHWGDRVLAVEAESRICSDAIVTGVDPERRLVYLTPDWHGWRDEAAGEEPTPHSAACSGCGQPYADEESGVYLFTSREGLGRHLHADGWKADPVLCPACQPEEASS